MEIAVQPRDQHDQKSALEALKGLAHLIARSAAAEYSDAPSKSQPEFNSPRPTGKHLPARNASESHA